MFEYNFTASLLCCQMSKHVYAKICLPVGESFYAKQTSESEQPELIVINIHFIFIQ